MKQHTDPAARAALVAGLAVLMMALTVPVAEFYIFPTLVDHDDPAQTVRNITEKRALFASAVFIHFGTIVLDIVSGWALYLFLKPVNKNVALLSAWFRIANAAFTAVALANLVQIFVHINQAEVSNAMGDVPSRVMYHLKAFDLQWRFMLIFFGVYMNLLGWLTLHATYVPKVMGVLLIITGLGYMADNLKYFFYPGVDTGFLWFTYFGELIFMFWLLFKGSRLRLEVDRGSPEPD